MRETKGKGTPGDVLPGCHEFIRDPQVREEIV